MKRSLVLAVAIAAVLIAMKLSHSEETTAAPATQPFSDQYQTASYGIGYEMGKSIKQSRVKLDPVIIAQGINDAMTGADRKVSAEQLRSAMMMVQQEASTNAQADMSKEAEANQKLAEAYRADFEKKPGVVKTKSGLLIQTIKEGTGATPTASDKVKVNYAGTLIDGTEFDASAKHGGPATFGVSEVISGWTEALQTMKVGGKIKVVIPPELGYGPRGAGGSIPPNATLTFDVELVDIVK